MPRPVPHSRRPVRPANLPGPVMRGVDIVLAGALGLLVAPLLLAALLAVWLCDGRPLFYPAERMRAPGRPFTMWKLRTMRPSALPPGPMAGARVAHVTPLGHWLRASRIDELPQLWNVLRGDMALVGPRPPLRRHVEAYPALYAPLLRARPGLTGLATLAFFGREGRLLARCASTAEAEALYAHRLLPRKARLDRLWLARRSLWGDLGLILRTGLGLVRAGLKGRGRGRASNPHTNFQTKTVRIFLPLRAAVDNR